MKEVPNVVDPALVAGRYRVELMLENHHPWSGEVTVEGVEFMEIGPGCFQMGSEKNAEGGDWLGGASRRCSVPRTEPSGIPSVHQDDVN